MFKIFTKYLFFLIICTVISYSQNFSNEKSLIRDKNDNSKKSSISVIQINISNKVSNPGSSQPPAYQILYENLFGNVNNYPKTNRHEDKSFFGFISSIRNNSFVSSVRNNIKIQAYADGYTVVNFTPAMQIQLTDFISFSANHNICEYYPVKYTKNNIEPVLLQSAAVLSIDKYFKNIFVNNKMLQSIAGFLAKNLAIGLVDKVFKSSAVQVNGFMDYYYSMNIRF